MSVLKSIKFFVDKAVEWVCIILLAVMTCLVTYQVVTRFVFENPSAISEITAQYLFVWMVMLGSAYVFGLREHLSITLLKDKLSPMLNMLVEWLISLLLITFSVAIMLYGGVENTIVQMGTLDAALQIPMGVIYSVIPISAIIMIFYAIYNMALAMDEYKNKKIRLSDDTAGTM